MLQGPSVSSLSLTNRILLMAK